jgi:hypothetical protein
MRCLLQALYDDLSTCHLLEGTVLLTKVTGPNGVVEGVIGSIVIGIRTTWER